MEPINVEEAVKQFEGDLTRFIEEYIRNNLTISIDAHRSFEDSITFNVELKLGKEVISEDSVRIRE